MTKQVRVILDGVEAVARLHEDAAPQTVARFWAALPIEAVLRHVRWSGEAGYILISQLADKTQPLENAISFYPPGSSRARRDGLLLRPGAGAGPRACRDLGLPSRHFGDQHRRVPG